jgi:hypothetical protein
MFSLIPYFIRVQPSNVVDALNRLIDYINANFAATGFIYAGSVTRRQFFSALAASNLMQTVESGIPGNANNAVYIEWMAGLTITPNDALAQNVQSTLGYSPAQMAALFALAATQTP